MITVLGVLGVLAVLFVAAVVATRDEPLLADAPPDRADLGLPAGRLGPADVSAVRLPLAVRGYRMAEVDQVLDRLATELRARDAEIVALRAFLDPPGEHADPPAVGTAGCEVDPPADHEVSPSA